MGLFSRKPPPEETPEEASAPRVVTSDREVEVVVPAGAAGRNYRKAVAALGVDGLAPGDSTWRVDVALVRRGPEEVVVRAKGYDLGVVPAARHAIVSKAMASAGADVVRVRAKLWCKRGDGTYGVRLFIPWGLKAPSE